MSGLRGGSLLAKRRCHHRAVAGRKKPMKRSQARGWPSHLDMASTVKIGAPPAIVWEAFSDAPRWPEWCGVCLGVWGVSANPWQPGGGLSFKLRIGGVPVPFSVTVVDADPPHRVAWASTKLTVTATRTFTFDEQDGSSLVTDGKLFESWLLPLRLFYPRPLIRRMTESWLRDLKCEAERLAGGRSS